MRVKNKIDFLKDKIVNEEVDDQLLKDSVDDMRLNMYLSVYKTKKQTILDVQFEDTMFKEISCINNLKHISYDTFNFIKKIRIKH